MLMDESFLISFLRLVFSLGTMYSCKVFHPTHNLKFQLRFKIVDFAGKDTFEF